MRAVDGRIVHFDTFMTGEVYAALSSHTILGRTMQRSETFDAVAFDRGVAVALSPEGAAGPLSTIFSCRTSASLAPWPVLPNPIICPVC